MRQQRRLSIPLRGFALAGNTPNIKLAISQCFTSHFRLPPDACHSDFETRKVGLRACRGVALVHDARHRPIQPAYLAIHRLD